jgi:cytochrome c556
MKALAPALLIVFVVTTPPSSAHDHATGVVKLRMDAMNDMANRYKAIAEKIRDKRDLDTIKGDAGAIASHAPHIVHLFPKDSMQKPTRARAAIWQNWVDFQAKAKGLEDVSLRLAGTNANDAAELGRARTAMSQACDACHDKYRTRR